MHNPVSGDDGIQRVDVALLVGDAGYRYGVLHFPLADASPTEESFETIGAYASVGGRGLGVTSNLAAHTVSIRHAPAHAPTDVVLDAASLPDTAAEKTSWTRTVPVEESDLRYEIVLTTTPDSARVTIHLRTGETTWFSTSVHATRSSNGDGGSSWTTAHDWTAHDPF